MRKTPSLLILALSLLGITLNAQTTTGLQLWLKPEGITNTAAESPISFWTDSSSGGFHATNTAAGRQPIYTSSALNGFPVAHFTGDGVGAANNYLQSPLPYNASTNPFTTVIVYKPNFVGNRAQLIHQVGGYPILYLLPNSSPSKTNLISNASGQLVTNSILNDASWKIVTLVEDATSIKMYENGALVGSTDLTLPAIGTSGGGFVFGARQNKTAFGYNGDIAEIMIYTNALNSTERATTENYLATKYNLATAVSLLSDNFNTVADPADLNEDLAIRQSGLLAPQSYFSGGGPVNIVGGRINMDNSAPSGGYDYYYASPNVNILPYEGGATVQISFDIVNLVAASTANQNDSWAAFTLSQYPTPGGPVTDWGMLIRTNGTGVVFGAFAGFSVTASNLYHVDMTISKGNVQLSINGTDVGTTPILCPLTFSQSFMQFGLGVNANGPASVSFDNLVVTRTSTSSTALPSSLKLSDNFNSADSTDINANLARQTGPAAPVAYITNGNLNAAHSISGNQLVLTNSPGGSVSIGMVSPAVDFRQLENLNSFSMTYTVSATNDATSNESWVGLRFRDNAPSHFVADADGGGTGINFFTGDGRWFLWQSMLGASNTSSIVASGTVPVAGSYAFEIEVRTNTLRMKINGATLVLGCGEGAYNLPASQAANYVTLHNFVGNPATSGYAAFDDFQFNSLDMGLTVPAPTIVNPRSLESDSAFGLSFDSSNNIFYAVDSKSDLNASTWSYLGGVIGNGTLVSYTNNAATNGTGFYRVRVP